MPNIKTEINHNVLTQIIENSMCMEYSEQKVKLIDRFIEKLRNNTMEKCIISSQRYFMRKGLKTFER